MFIPDSFFGLIISSEAKQSQSITDQDRTCTSRSSRTSSVNKRPQNGKSENKNEILYKNNSDIQKR